MFNSFTIAGVTIKGGLCRAALASQIIMTANPLLSMKRKKETQEKGKGKKEEKGEKHHG